MYKGVLLVLKLTFKKNMTGCESALDFTELS